MIKTLASGLQPASVDFETLHKRYNPVLVLVKELIGIVPNCDPVLEIWPPGFRSYNLLVPNLFNLPQTLFGNRSFKASMGLAMYAASKTASCAYCTAHSCSFALRRGASRDAIVGNRTPREQAVVALAEGLARIPADLTMDEINSVKKYFSGEQVEWLALAVSMMGFLNKFMNAMGIELEQDALNDTASVLAPTGWQPGQHVNGTFRVTKKTNPKRDNLLTYLRVIRQAPGAIALEKKWTRGVPEQFPAVGEYLREHTGYSFPLLKPVNQGRVLRAITTVLKDNLNRELSTVGLKIKMIAGILFCKVVANASLDSEVTHLAAQLAPELNEEIHNKLQEIAFLEIPASADACKEQVVFFQQHLAVSDKEAAALLLAMAAAPSPAQVNDAVLETVVAQVEPSGIVELIVWLSVLQLLHRLSSYYSAVQAY